MQGQRKGELQGTGEPGSDMIFPLHSSVSIDFTAESIKGKNFNWTGQAGDC